MDSHTHSHDVFWLDIVETGRRRRWSEAEKLRIVVESASGPRLVSATARRHGIAPSQLFGWRRAFKLAGIAGDETTAPAFLPVRVKEDEAPVPRVGSAACNHKAKTRVEIELGDGRIVRIADDIDPQALARILDVLERRG